MVNELRLAPEAEQDIAGAYAWYESRRAGLGEEFMSCVEARLQAIRRTPGACAHVHGDYRRALVRRFPYSIFYEEQAGIVTVYCIFHNSRDPLKWRDRLP